MAELRYEAPLAAFDMDEWNDLLDVAVSDDVTSVVGSPKDDSPLVHCSKVVVNTTFQHSTADDFDDESFSGSLEDLVNSFDEKITKCFRNYSDRVENLAPVQTHTIDDIITTDSQSWWAITDRYGNGIYDNDNFVSQQSQNENKILASIHTSTEQHRITDDHTLSYNNRHFDNISDYNDNEHHDDNDDDDNESTSDIDEYGVCDYSSDSDTDVTSDDDDDDDYDDDDKDDHNEDVTNEGEGVECRRILSADEVITELEILIDGTPRKLKRAGGTRALSSSVSAELRQYAQSLLDKETTIQDELEGLQKLSVRALMELKAELEACIIEHSENLVQELARRDDLDYEKELKNEFIWLLLTVQRKRKDATMTHITLKELTNQSRPNNGEINGNEYLTTVIPYQSTAGPPAIEKLQIYIRLLSAINENANQVPTLLTDYILKVLCPTT